MRIFLTRVVEAAIVSGRLPRPAVKVAFALAASAARLLGRVASSTGLLEFGNILEAIRHFAGSRLGARRSLMLQGEGQAGFEDADEAGLSPVFGSATFEVLWATEGLGYWNAKSALKQANPNRPVDLFISNRLPTRCRGIFHVGSTIALAEHCIRRAVKDSPEDLEGALQSYLRTCRERSPEAFRGIEAESLGFVTVTLFPEVLYRAADVLVKYHRPMRKYFWHGVGRGFYFKYPQVLDGPGRTWSALKWILKMPVDPEDGAEALVGFSWALVLVNLRHPSVICDRVDALCTSECDTEPLVRGVGEAFLCWHRWTGWEENLERIRTFAPAGGRQAKAWRSVVVTALDQMSQRSAAGRAVRSKLR